MEAVRPADAGDIPRIVELGQAMRDELEPMRGGVLWRQREGASEPLGATFERALGDPYAALLLGTIDGAAMGYALAQAELLPDGSRLGVIVDLFVEAGVREVGLGEALLDEVLARFAAWGCVGADAVALPGNRAVKNFFEEQGFTARLLRMHRTGPFTATPPGSLRRSPQGDSVAGS